MIHSPPSAGGVFLRYDVFRKNNKYIWEEAI